MKYRASYIFQYIDKGTKGLEIGPSHNPIAPKKEGFNVHILDHLYEDELKEKYRDKNVCIDNIEKVDFKWTGEAYKTLVGVNRYNWIIASHVIEHTPDLIGFLKECASILEDNGTLCLVVPDKRYCFDHFRPLTSLSQIIDNHLQKRVIHSPGKVAEYYLNIATKDDKLAWTSFDNGSYSTIYSISDTSKIFNESLNSESYTDLHAWCFTPSSFQLILHDLAQLDLIPFSILDCSQLVDYEFHITLQKSDIILDDDFDRISFMKNIEYELSLQITIWSKIKRLMGYVLHAGRYLRYKIIQAIY